MEKTIYLTKAQYVRLGDTEPFIVAENDDLTLKFDTFYDVRNAVITLYNNGVKRSLKLVSPLVVPRELLFEGKLCFSIDMYLDGKQVKHWDGLPIRLKEADGDIKCFDELAELEKRISVLEKQNQIIL